MTPKKNKLTPRAAIRWLEQLRRASERRSGADTIYQIRYMFKYIEKILQYQEVMIPEVEESGRFICPRCKHGRRLCILPALRSEVEGDRR